MKKKETILYYCTSVYQVLILTMMVELRYSQYKNIIILESNIASKLDTECENPYIDEIIILPSKKSASKIEKEFCDLFGKNNVTLFGFFTWGGNGEFIYNLIPDEVEIILLDEGVSTCDYKKFMSYVVDDIDFSRIKEIWMLDINISQNDKTIPEYKIPLEDICCDKLRFKKYLNIINSLFKYHWKPIEGDILFFDRYLVQLGRIPVNYERFVLENLIRLIGNKKLNVKIHPFENKKLAEWRYRELPVYFCEESDVPWEIIVLNYMYEAINTGSLSGFPQVLIATNTTTLFTTQSLLYLIGIEVPIIYINKILHDCLKDIEVVAEKTLEEYQNIYASRKIYLPLNWEEFYHDLSICLSDLVLDTSFLKEIYENEYALLKSEYKKTLRIPGNLLQQVYIEVDYEDIILKKKKEEMYDSFIIGGEEQYRLIFKEFMAENALRIKIRLFPVGVPLVCKKVTLNQISYQKDDIRTEKIQNEKFVLSNKKPYISFEIDAGNCKISELEIDYSIDKEYHLLFETEQSMRFRNYYDILIKWITLLQEKRDCFSSFCEKQKYKKIGVYGNGTIGRLLRTQLISCGVETIIIDKREGEGLVSIPQILDDLEEWDLIVITPLFDHYNIEKTFGFSEKVIGLDDLLCEMEEIQ